jgi:HEAT repeat protein
VTTPSPPPPETGDELLRAVVVAGHTGDRATVSAALGSARPEIRVAALGAAGRTGLLDDDRLLHALTDPAPDVRRRAAQLAGRRTVGAEVVSALVAALDDVEPVAEMAAFSLGELERADDEVVDALSRVATSHPDHLCREAAVAALGAVGAGLPAILHALGHDRATVRRRAVIALAPFEGPEVDAALAIATGDRDWQVRQAAEDLTEP